MFDKIDLPIQDLEKMLKQQSKLFRKNERARMKNS